MKHKLLVLLLSFATFGCESDYTLIRVEPYEPPVEEEIPTVVEDPPITIDIIPLEPDIIVTPTYYDFGDLVSGCPEYTEILIENIGTAPLTVDSLLFSTSGDITLDYNGNGAFPWTILP
ncbi:MAG: hypothetical protein CMQ41_07990, partial [Gammaproteobacteria bacterium]|nr:hypothetical protein [Gammaproteobacteria bacterium]